MPRDLSTYQAFNAWFAQRARETSSRNAYLQGLKYKPFRRTGPAPQWHPDSYSQPGEVE